MRAMWRAIMASLLVVSAGVMPTNRVTGSEPGNANADADLGRAIYTNCAACHGDRGQGGSAPPFAGNANAEYTHFLIAYVMSGSRRMPSFAEQLSPEEVAAVLSHVRNSWGNAYGPVDAHDVEAVRDGTK